LNYAVGGKCYGEGSKVITETDIITLSPAEIQANCDKYGRLYDWAMAMDIDARYNKNGAEAVKNIKAFVLMAGISLALWSGLYC